MYAGEVNVAQDQLPAFLKTAERLKVKGLAEAKGVFISTVNLNNTWLDLSPNQDMSTIPSEVYF